MYAIIDVGGKQYKVSVGDTIFLEKLDVNENSDCIFDKVAAIIEDGKSSFGAPYLKGSSVVGNVLKTGKCKKIRVFKYKPKKNYSRRYGHRQYYTKVEIKEIKS